MSKMRSCYILLFFFYHPGFCYSQGIPVPNGNFEVIGENISSWYFPSEYKDKVVAQIDSLKPYKGKCALRLTMPIADTYGRVQQGLNIQAVNYPRVLKISMAARVENGSVADGYVSYFNKGEKKGASAYFSEPLIRNSDWKIYDSRLLVPAGVDSLTIEVSTKGTGSAWFDDIKVAFINTKDPPSPNIKKAIAQALRFAKNSYWKRDSVNWQDIERTVFLMATGVSDYKRIYPAIKVLIRSLNDPHAFMLTGEQNRDQSSSHPNLNENKPVYPSSELLDNQYGYLNVTHCFTSSPVLKKKYADTLLHQIMALDQNHHLTGWIVDLRSNGGGYCDPMIAGLSPLYGPGFICGSEHFDKARFGQKDSSFVIPKDGKYAFFSITPYWPIYDLPIAVLSGKGTGSSGEIVLIGFKNFKRARIFGEPSAGVPTGPAPFKLPDGGLFAITTETRFDRAGVSYATFIDPDVIVHNPNNDRALVSDPVVKAAKEWLFSISR